MANQHSNTKQVLIVAGAAVVVAALLLRRKQNKSRLIEEGCDPEKMGVSLSLLNAAPIMGKEKYLGGVLGADGIVYGIPGHSDRVLRIDPKTDEVTYIGPILKGKYKWLRGVASGDYVYGVPCHAESVLKINVVTQEVTTFGGPWPGDWKWHGGVLADDGCIYGIPQMHPNVLKINLDTEECSLIGGPWNGKNKWYGGLLSPLDGNIYGICQNANGVLKINVTTQQCTVIGEFPEGGFKWHGGNVGIDGNVYGVPCHADHILKVDVLANTAYCMEAKIPASVRRPDGKYKYLGGVNGSDGNIYFIPSDADYVTKLDPRTGETTQIGETLEHEAVNHTKWQNGYMAPDGCIYSIPHGGRTVCRVNLDTQEVCTLKLPEPYVQLSKWEGGVVTDDGTLYCMPMCSKHVLKISPHLKAVCGAALKGWGGGRAHD